MTELVLTKEQTSIVDHDGVAFVSACPGAGKTRCIVERARNLLSQNQDYSGIAFLSFTNAAISELENRLKNDGLLAYPTFPHFIGTFDSFIWHYLVQPFGISSSKKPLKLIPDIGKMPVSAYQGSREFPLEMFDRTTGGLDLEKAAKQGFTSNPAGYEHAATRMRETLSGNGYLDFQDVRDAAIANINKGNVSPRLAILLRAKYREIIVDEAQDCNPEDLFIVDWLRTTVKIPLKVVCDPHQSIYGFRGGVNQELFDFAKTFKPQECFTLTGNFRSTENICKANYMLRAPSHRGVEDQSLGDLKDSDISVYILSYAGAGVSSEIGLAFQDLAGDHGLSTDSCRLIAKTRSSCFKANGVVSTGRSGSFCMMLANAAMSFQHSSSALEKLKAVTEAHKISLSIAGKLQDKTYTQAIIEYDLEELS